MPCDEIVLDFTRKGGLPCDTSIYQTDDGTIFYYKYSSPRRLYVKWDDEDIDAELPDDKINCDGTYGDAIYFNSNRKIYKAVFSPPDSIDVSYQRKQRMDEKIRWRFCSRVRDEAEYAYQVCDDPDEDGIAIRANDEMELRRLHRGKAIYFSNKEEASGPSVAEVTDSEIVIEVCDMHPLYASDTSTFIYIADAESLHTLNTDTMEFLPILRTDGVTISYIVGVHDGVIAIKGRMDEDCLMTAQLPLGYFPTISVELNALSPGIQLSATQRLSEGIDLVSEEHVELIMKEYQAKNCELEKEVKRNRVKKIELTSKINELRKKNAEITEEKERSEKQYNELKSTIDKLQRKFSELTQVNDRIHKVNQDENAKLKATLIELREDNVELRAENDRIRKVHKNEKLELTDMIEILREEIAELTQEDMSETSEEQKDDQFDTIKDLQALIAQLRGQDRTLKLSESEKLPSTTVRNPQAASSHRESAQNSRPEIPEPAPPAVSPVPNDPVPAAYSSMHTSSPFLSPPSTLPRRLVISPLASPHGTLRAVKDDDQLSRSAAVTKLTHSPSKKRERSEGLKTVVANLRRRFEQGEFTQDGDDTDENEEVEEEEEKTDSHHFLRFPSVRL